MQEPLLRTNLNPRGPDRLRWVQTNQSIIIMKTISNSKDAYEAIKGFVKYPEQEELFIICLSKANGIKNIHFIGLGSDDAVCISSKVIAKQAVLDMACGVILIHTHPSGNPRPSPADIKQTERVRQGLNYFDILLLDHLVLGDGCYYSFSEDDITNL